MIVADMIVADMIVAELMTENAVGIDAKQPLSEATRLMWEYDCGALPVVNDEGRVLAMITDRDICMATWLQKSPPAALTVFSTMSHHLYYCLPTDTVSSVERLMRAKQIRRVPVLSADGQLVGMLSLADIARQARGGTAVGLLPNDLTDTLAEICSVQRSSFAARA